MFCTLIRVPGGPHSRWAGDDGRHSRQAKCQEDSQDWGARSGRICRWVELLLMSHIGLFTSPSSDAYLILIA